MRRTPAPRGISLIEILVAVAIFVLLTSLVIANFGSARGKNDYRDFNQRLLELYQRASNYAQTGHGSFRCANSATQVCTVNSNCPSSTCDTTPPSGGWGVHYTAVNQPAPQPASFKLYGDRQDAECVLGKVGTCSNNGSTCYSNDDCGYNATCNFPSPGDTWAYRCYANPNRRFDYYYGQGGLNNAESRSCQNFKLPKYPIVTSGLSCLTNGFQDDIVDSSVLGTLSVPSNIFVEVYQGVPGGTFQLVSDVADFNFSLTTGKAFVGSKASATYRDPTNSKWNSYSILAKVCTSTVAAGPYYKIIINASGFIVDGGEGNTSC